MKHAYLKFYEKSSPLAIMRLSWDALWTSSKRRKLSLMNRQRDYAAMTADTERLALHRKLNGVLLRASKEWDSYDYGEGYFYQSCPRLGISGLRDTALRIESMGLQDLLKGKQVFEIGSNTGFLGIELADIVESLVGCEINPFLIEIAKESAQYLGVQNLEFTAEPFEDFAGQRSFDAVISFANHSTYDGNTRQSLETFFGRCQELTRPGGILVFESHPPAHEGSGLEKVCALIEDLFIIEERKVLNYGTFLDEGRTFIVARRQP